MNKRFIINIWASILQKPVEETHVTNITWTKHKRD